MRRTSYAKHFTATALVSLVFTAIALAEPLSAFAGQGSPGGV